jgi:hypothetical protein
MKLNLAQLTSHMHTTDAAYPTKQVPKTNQLDSATDVATQLCPEDRSKPSFLDEQQSLLLGHRWNIHRELSLSYMPVLMPKIARQNNVV